MNEFRRSLTRILRDPSASPHELELAKSALAELDARQSSGIQTTVEVRPALRGTFDPVARYAELKEDPRLDSDTRSWLGAQVTADDYHRVALLGGIPGDAKLERLWALLNYLAGPTCPNRKEPVETDPQLELRN